MTKTLIIRPQKLGADASLSEQVIREVCDKFGHHGTSWRGYKARLMRAFREWRNEKIAKVRPVQVVEFKHQCVCDYILHVNYSYSSNELFGFESQKSDSLAKFTISRPGMMDLCPQREDPGRLCLCFDIK
jgi:hypothetical protein